MGFFRFRRSVKILPGLRWNIGKRGSSFSVGGRGMTVNFSKRGTRTTVGIPGSGLSYTSTSKSKRAGGKASKASGCGCGSLLLIVFAIGGIGALFSGGKEHHVSSSSSSNTSSSIPNAEAPAPTIAQSHSMPSAQPLIPLPEGLIELSPQSTQTIVKARKIYMVSQNLAELPKEVHLLSSASLPIIENGREVGVARLPAGVALKVVTANANDVIVLYQGMQFAAPIASTDLLDRIPP